MDRDATGKWWWTRHLDSALTSSISSTAFHLDAISHARSSFRFRSSALVPSLPLPMMYKGRRRCSLIASADNVFPTPGGPNKLITKPWPFPLIKSSKGSMSSSGLASIAFAFPSISDRRRFFRACGRTRFVKASSSQSMGTICFTLNSTTAYMHVCQQPSSERRNRALCVRADTHSKHCLIG